MAFGVCFNFEDQLLYRDQWIVVCDNYLPDYVYDRNPPDVELDDIYYKWTPVDSISDGIARGTAEGLTPVLITPLNAQIIPGEISLKDYTHPTNALYVFGDDNNTLDNDYGITDKVYVHSLNQQVTYWSFMVASIVLFDRVSKQ